MKKTLYIFFISLISIFILANTFAEDIKTETNISDDKVVVETTKTGIVSTGSLIETTSEPLLINNNIEETSYIYYYGQGCSHCANLDKYINSVDGYEKLNIIKKEIYFDDNNRQEMLSEGKRLGLEESKIGVPFFIINESGLETPMIGDGPIIEHLKNILGEAPENKNKTIVFAILIILAIILPVFLIKLSNKN